jgi:hypothetical protein
MQKGHIKELWGHGLAMAGVNYSSLRFNIKIA